MAAADRAGVRCEGRGVGAVGGLESIVVTLRERCPPFLKGKKQKGRGTHDGQAKDCVIRLQVHWPQDSSV